MYKIGKFAKLVGVTKPTLIRWDKAKKLLPAKRVNNVRFYGIAQLQEAKRVSLPDKHGMCKTRFYSIWSSMKDRVLNSNNTGYHKYGGRGINLCKRWHRFIYFKEDMYEPYLKHLDKYGESETTIDRIDNDGNYCVENCRWSTLEEQGNNTRKNVNFTYKGETKALTKWARDTGINHVTLYFRLNSIGMSIEEALETPVKPQIILHEYKGRKQTLRDWCNELNIEYNKVRKRITAGWLIKDTLETPIKVYNYRR